MPVRYPTQPPTRAPPWPAADKNNKREHRGFGFVTFETEAAIQRVVAHGPHHIRGSIVAIDSAVPRQVRACRACWAAAGRRGLARRHPLLAGRPAMPLVLTRDPPHPTPTAQEEMLLAVDSAGLAASTALAVDREAADALQHQLDVLSLEGSGRGRGLLRPF